MHGRITTWSIERRPQCWTMADDRSCRPAHPDDTLRGALQPRWRTGSPWLLDSCDEEVERAEQSSPTFNLQWRVSSVVHGYKKQCLFALLHFRPDDNWSNQSKRHQVIFWAKLVPDNLFIYTEANWEATEENVLVELVLNIQIGGGLVLTFSGTWLDSTVEDGEVAIDGWVSSDEEGLE